MISVRSWVKTHLQGQPAVAWALSLVRASTVAGHSSTDDMVSVAWRWCHSSMQPPLQSIGVVLQPWTTPVRSWPHRWRSLGTASLSCLAFIADPPGMQSLLKTFANGQSDWWVLLQCVSSAGLCGFASEFFLPCRFTKGLCALRTSRKEKHVWQFCIIVVFFFLSHCFWVMLVYYCLLIKPERTERMKICSNIHQQFN